MVQFNGEDGLKMIMHIDDVVGIGMGYIVPDNP